MSISKVVSVSIEIANQIFCEFEAQEITSKEGVVYIEIDEEKKIKKNHLAIGYYPKLDKIVLKTYGLNFSLDVISGDKDKFLGEYEIALLGRKGKIVIE